MVSGKEFSGVASVAHCEVGRPLSLRQMLDPVRAKFLHLIEISFRALHPRIRSTQANKLIN